MRKALVAALLVVLLSSCAPGSGEYGDNNEAGFFSGVWHGWIAPITLIVQIFDEDIRVYEPNNTGWFYDFGFYIAVISGFGSIGLARGKKKRGG
jgi:hypothetical protein